MRHRLPTLAALCALILPAALHAPLAQALTQRDTVGSREPTARVIVRYKPGATAMRALSAPITAVRGPQQAAALSQRLGLLLSDGHAIGDQAQVVFAKGISSAALAARLAADADVEFAEPDQRRRARAIPNDPLYGGSQPSVTPTVGQWYLRPPTSTNVSAIDAETAWLTTTGTSSVTVAVLDTGVRFDHPDLAGKLHPGYDFVSDVKTANDGTGRDSDPSDPGDWVTQAEVDNDPDFSSCGDAVGGSSWHGTQVAGLIGAATNNAFGMASVGRHVMVLPVRVLGKCGGFDSDIQQAMLWSAGVSSNPFANPHPAKVLNLSFGSPGSCPTSYQTVINTLTAAGVSVVVSAGNDPGLAVNAPANCSGAIAVSSVRHIGTKVGFSSIGTQVALSAPGGNCVNGSGACLFPLLTTDNSGSQSPGSSTFSDSFISSLGTSFSSPLVAGAAALMLSVNPALTPATIRSTLRSTARPFPTSGAGGSVPVCHAPDTLEQVECYCTTSTCGAGMLDVSAAVAAVAPAAAPTAPFSASTSNPTVGTPVTLTAPDATVAAGGSGTYLWEVISGGSIASITSANNGQTATLVATSPGTVTVRLTVTDSSRSLSTSASATLLAQGAPPTAVIAPASSNVSVGSNITLDGASSAAAGAASIVGYEWTIVGSDVDLDLIGASNASTVTLQGAAAGSAVVQLRVTDSVGASTVTSATVNVLAAAAIPVPASSGGGALGGVWLLGLAAAIVALRRRVA